MMAGVAAGKIGARWHEIGTHLPFDELAVLRLLEIVDHLGDAEEADGDRHEADAVSKLAAGRASCAVCPS